MVIFVCVCHCTAIGPCQFFPPVSLWQCLPFPLNTYFLPESVPFDMSTRHCKIVVPLTKSSAYCRCSQFFGKYFGPQIRLMMGLYFANSTEWHLVEAPPRQLQIPFCMMMTVVNMSIIILVKIGGSSSNGTPWIGHTSIRHGCYL